MTAKLDEVVAYLKATLTGRPSPLVLVICGSGLSELSNTVESANKLTIAYSSIPNFPRVSVQGHAGELVFGQLSGVEAMILRGRFHSYEGHSMEDCVLPVRVARRLGCKLMIVTNAAGGINRDFEIGDIALISDHIGFPLLAGKNPLVGPNDSTLGPRFPAMSDAYDERLRHLAKRVGDDLGLGHLLRTKATYAFVSGPNYETAAECAMLRLVGADLVGMSTAPEVVAARHCGLRVLGISLVTNKVVLPGDVNPVHASHEEVLATTKIRTRDVQRLVEGIVAELKAHEAEADMSRIANPAVPTAPKSNSVKPSTNAAIEHRLRQIDVSRITPLEAIQVLGELKAMLD
jgi:purine-nucleoside phosphorylase